LTAQTISVTLPGGVADFLHRRAERQRATVPETLVSIATAVMEDEEDEISDEEDRRLSALVAEREAEQEGKRYYTHQEAWGV
jgi:hypothetical protein